MLAPRRSVVRYVDTKEILSGKLLMVSITGMILMITICCVICSGMRTHIRMHFDKKTNDFNEESYISCTLDEENNEAHAQAATLSSSALTNQSSSPENAQSIAAATAQTHHCDKCSYSSTFKGNLVCVFTIIERKTVKRKGK